MNFVFRKRTKLLNGYCGGCFSIAYVCTVGELTAAT